MPIQSVDPKTLQKWLDNHEAILIDVREPGENKTESISGAYLLPLSQVSVFSLPAGKAKKIALHCRSGKRSRTACEILAAQNPELELYNLDGGILAWKQAGLPVQTSKILPGIKWVLTAFLARMPWSR